MTRLLALGLVVLATAPLGAGAQPPRSDRDPRPAAPAPAAADYRLAIGDKLRVEVYREPQLSQSVEVRPDGKITMPLVGDIAAAGLTTNELAGALTQRLRDYLTNPVVTVAVVEATPPYVYVVGEVNNPGAIPLRTPLTVLQALAMAGGFKDFANTKKIRILRRGARGVETIPFNYKEAIEGRGRPIPLQPGDTIVVP
ncbi:MAG TPA: polysaccharide biosynthesis/export family protein [Vicinamibacterales bacterium]|nr:polysaccharide biosynthesis/export family protein [Vicinamibacterales bacterium]